MQRHSRCIIDTSNQNCLPNAFQQFTTEICQRNGDGTLFAPLIVAASLTSHNDIRLWGMPNRLHKEA